MVEDRACTHLGHIDNGDATEICVNCICHIVDDGTSTDSGGRRNGIEVSRDFSVDHCDDT